MNEAVIVSAARTAIGSYGRSLRGVPSTELGTAAARAAIDRSGIEPGRFDHVIFGNVMQTSRRDPYMARVVGIQAGLAKEVPALTVNRLCGSGLQSIVSAAQVVRLGDSEVVLAGGAESMSRVPFWSHDTRWGARLGSSELEDALQGSLNDPFGDVAMGVTAENLAERDGISREDQDRFAVESHQRAAAARAAGHFRDQIVPIEVKERRQTRVFEEDEHIRPDISLESLAQLKTVFKKDGTVTAGNASGMNDAGAAVVVTSAAAAEREGAKVKARIVGYATCGVEPSIMGIGPAPAIRKLLHATGVSLDEIGVIELNEAFAAQSLAVIRDLDLDPAKVNPNGGAVAMGHPIAASGTIVTIKAISEMERSGHSYGLVSLCIGGGQGIAMLLAAP